MFSDIALGYNKNDFFYVTAEENGKMPSNNECQSIINDTDFDYQTICRTGNEEQRTVFNTGDIVQSVFNASYASIKTKYPR